MISVKKADPNGSARKKEYLLSLASQRFTEVGQLLLRVCASKSALR
jgi:hypothetical protein